MIKLVRLDYRLLHGQVVFSWTGHVGAQRIIVVDDDAANDEMKKSALLLSKPAGVRVNISSRWTKPSPRCPRWSSWTRRS